MADSGDERTAVRVAHSEAGFRGANERIAAHAGRFVETSDFEELPFLCECPREACTEILRITLPAYRKVRAHGRRFVCLAAHARHEGDASERVVREQPGYVVIEKLGTTGELAERLA